MEKHLTVEDEEVIISGLEFLSALGRRHGSERAMDLWNAMGSALGDDIKGAVFFRMLTGYSTRAVRARVISSSPHFPNMVSAIKAVRTATGMGLKDAKDLVDASKTETTTIHCADSHAAAALRSALRDLGMDVS